MAAVLVQTSGKQKPAFGTGPFTINMPAAFTAGNRVIVSICAYTNGSGAITGVQIGGSVSATQRAANSLTNRTYEFWDTTALPAGLTSAVQISAPGAVNVLTFTVEEWAGLGPGTAFDSGSQVNATGTSASPSVTSNALAQPNELVYSLMGTNTSNLSVTITSPSGWTEAMNEGDGTTSTTGAAAYKTVASTAAVTAGYTISTSNPWAELIASWAVADEPPALPRPRSDAAEQEERAFRRLVSLPAGAGSPALAQIRAREDVVIDQRQLRIVAIPSAPYGPLGVIVLNFGISSGSSYAITFVPYSSIGSGSYVEAYLMGDVTAKHNAYEHLVVPMKLTCSVVAGSGFTVSGVSPFRLTGTFLVHYVVSV
jgi:hypothetical protein